MDRDAYIDLLAGLLPPMRERVFAAIGRILALAEPYRGRGEGFAFADYPELDREVNAVLRELSDECLEITREAMRRAETLLAFEGLDYDVLMTETESQGDGALWAFDMHSSNLKRLLEGWIAIWFAGNLTRSDMFSRIIGHIEAPESAPMWRDAVREHLVDPYEYKFGKGYQRNIPNAMKVLAAWLVMSFVARAMQEDAIGRGVEYYIIHRGSRYDCPECDSNCEIPLPVEDWRLPQHPNCMCWAEFITPET